MQRFIKSYRMHASNRNSENQFILKYLINS
jgi:hypothetical protein